MTGLLARIVGTRFDRAWVIETMTETRKLEITRPRVSCAVVTCFRAKRLHCCFFWIKSSTRFSVMCTFFLRSYLWIILNLTDNSVMCRLWVCQVHSCFAFFFFYLRRFDSDIEGGESLFLDAFYVAEEFRKQFPKEFDDLVRIPGTFQKIHFERYHRFNIERLCVTVPAVNDELLRFGCHKNRRYA